MKEQPNALASFLPVQTLDDQLASLVTRFGAEAVRDATKRATAKKRGRKPEKDWVGLRPWVEQDSDDWLNGRDAFALRSNYSIAKAFAEQNPGHNPFATKDRIERKLRELRRWYMLVNAFQLAETGYPLETYVRVLRELEQLQPGKHWAWFLERALGREALYRERFGEPAPEKSFQQLQDELEVLPTNALAGLIGSTTGRTGLFGSNKGRK